MGIAFEKMQGIGNDFVVLDLRGGLSLPDRQTMQRMGDRRFGIGFDQLLTLEKPNDPRAVLAYRIFNTDGSIAGQCGNGARCIALLASKEAPNPDAFVLESPAGLMPVTRLRDNNFRIEMGVPDFSPASIGLHEAAMKSVYRRALHHDSIEFGAVSMGNPHAVVVVDSVDDPSIPARGAAIQNAAWFVDGVNVGFVQVCARDRVRLRVIERGVGETLACGSGACAAVAVLRARGLVDERVHVQLPGGALQIAWQNASASMTMSGAAQLVYSGIWHE